MVENLLVLLIVVFAASLLQASTGFGFSIIGTPFLLMMFPAHTAIQLNIILSLVISLFMMIKIRAELNKPLMGRLIKGSLLLIVPGLMVYLYADITAIKLVVGILILLLTALLMMRFTIRQTRAGDYVTGGISGLLTMSIGVPGPPLLLYFSGAGADKSIIRSTTLAYYLFVYAISLITQIVFGGTDRDVWLTACIAIPVVVGGIVCGQLLYNKFSPATFKIVSYILLVFSGGYLLLTSF